jgi:hypothetical protein
VLSRERLSGVALGAIADEDKASIGPGGRPKEGLNEPGDALYRAKVRDVNGGRRAFGFGCLVRVKLNGVHKVWDDLYPRRVAVRPRIKSLHASAGEVFADGGDRVARFKGVAQKRPVARVAPDERDVRSVKGRYDARSRARANGASGMVCHHRAHRVREGIVRMEDVQAFSLMDIQDR